MTVSHKTLLALSAVILALITGCASVPKEVVELSYTAGQDMASLQRSYDNLIHEFYEQLRVRRIDYLENSWTPQFIENWVRDGKLVEVAKGELVWSEENSEFVSPASGEEHSELLQTVTAWADEAMYRIQDKRDSLVSPLYREEEVLRRDVSEAFSKIVQANATITAHLNSLRKVQEIQDQALEALHIGELRDKINNALATASQKAELGLGEIEKADRLVTKAEGLLENTDQ